MNLEKKIYAEEELVNRLCTPAQIRSYEAKNKFAGGKQRSMFLDKLATYCEYEYDKKNKTYYIICSLKDNYRIIF